MYIQNNILGINFLNNDKKNIKILEKSLGKLSSGRRINTAADDAAGLSISEKMWGQIRGLKMAKRNALDAYSMMETRDGALDEVQNMLQRMRELTVQSLNETLTDEDRGKLQTEFRALQISISKISKESQWNTKSLFELHESSFCSFEGNQRFNQIIKISEGFNNDLEISADGNITNIFLEGGYYTIGEIADIIDDKLIEKNPNLIINLTEENGISIQSENSSNIDYIKGGLSFLFYDYHMGTPPGMVIGVTEFIKGGRLNIIPGNNDKLNFYIGADRGCTISFLPKSGGYSIDELIDTINVQLKTKGENDVKAIKYLDKYIALYSSKYAITGLSGNMIKIDGITSVLYDNAKYGYISKSQGYVVGRKDLKNGIEVKKGINDTLRLKADDEVGFNVINLLDEEENSKIYTSDGIIKRINDEAERQGIGIIADGVSFGEGKINLRIQSNYFGGKSKVVLDPYSSAYNDLFVGENRYRLNPIENFGKVTQATIEGKYVINKITEIKKDYNDTLKLTVDGKTETIKLKERSYNSDELISEINFELKERELNAAAKLMGPTEDDKYAIFINNSEIGEGEISISEDSNGFEYLFCKSYFDILENKDGETKIVEGEEGIVGPIEVIETPAVLTGRADLKNGVNIDNTNDKLSFNMSGEDMEIVLDHGSFNARELSFMINDKLRGKNIDVGLKENSGYGTNLVFTTVNKGNGQYFRNIGGSAYSTVLAKTVYSKPANSDSGVTANYSIIGRTDIGNDFVIDDLNNLLSFVYTDGNKDENNEYKLDIELEKKTYTDTNINDLVSELNNKIKDKLREKGLSDDKISADLVNSKIRLNIKEPGADYKLNKFSGGFYDMVFEKEVISKLQPYSYSGYSNSKDEQITYVVGRENLNKEITIHPYINDVLIFDFHHNSRTETFKLHIDPGKYTSSGAVAAEIQSKLNKELLERGYESNSIKVQIGGVDSGTAIDDENKLVIKYESKDGINDNGSYIIDGVRGSAAYTVFYRAQGEPSPTHAVGVVDLSKGADIKSEINDTFIMDINGETKTIILEEKKYSSEELLNAINKELEEKSTNITASYYDGRLKLSFNEVGGNTIDGIRGNARGTLFFNVGGREFDKPEYFQIGANSGDTLIFDKLRISTELMRINTITIHKSSYANKALKRIDNAMDYLSGERGRIGAVQNRLFSVIHNNENYEENLTAANSRIKDVDMAREILEYTKQMILKQALQNMFIKINHYPEEVLKLLDW